MGLAPIGYPYIKYIMGRMARSRGDRIEKKKMGRPTDEPRTVRVGFRLSERETEMLDYCCEKLKVSKTEVIKKGLEKVYQELKK